MNYNQQIEHVHIFKLSEKFNAQMFIMTVNLTPVVNCDNVHVAINHFRGWCREGI